MTTTTKLAAQVFVSDWSARISISHSDTGTGAEVNLDSHPRGGREVYEVTLATPGIGLHTADDARKRAMAYTRAIDIAEALEAWLETGVDHESDVPVTRQVIGAWLGVAATDYGVEVLVTFGEIR